MTDAPTDLDPVVVDEWLTVQDVAARLRVPENTVRAWLRRGVGPVYYRLGPRLLRMRRSDVEAWQESNRRCTIVRSSRG